MRTNLASVRSLTGAALAASSKASARATVYFGNPSSFPLSSV